MATTTIRLDESLRARIVAVAERAGKTSHAFIVEAIADTVDRAECEAALHEIADTRWARILKTGETIPGAAVGEYLEARARGQSPPRPKARRPKP